MSVTQLLIVKKKIKSFTILSSIPIIFGIPFRNLYLRFIIIRGREREEKKTRFLLIYIYILFLIPTLLPTKINSIGVQRVLRTGDATAIDFRPMVRRAYCL